MKNAFHFTKNHLFALDIFVLQIFVISSFPTFLPCRPLLKFKELFNKVSNIKIKLTEDICHSL